MNNKKIITCALLTIFSATASFAGSNSTASEKHGEFVEKDASQYKVFNEIVLRSSTNNKVRKSDLDLNSEPKVEGKGVNRGRKGNPGGRCVPYPRCKIF